MNPFRKCVLSVLLLLMPGVVAGQSEDSIDYEVNGVTFTLDVVPGEFYVSKEGLLEESSFQAELLDELPGWSTKPTLPSWFRLTTTSNASEPPSLRLGIEDAATPIAELLRNLLVKFPGQWMTPAFTLRSDEVRTLHLPNRNFLIQLAPELNEDPERFLNRLDLLVEEEHFAEMKGLFLVSSASQTTGYDQFAYMNELQDLKEVLWVDPDFLYLTPLAKAGPAADCKPSSATIPFSGGDWLKDPQTGTFGINIDPAWDICGGGDFGGNSLITIGVLDDGVEYLHPDLAGNQVSAGKNFTVGDNSCTALDPAEGYCIAGHLTGEHYQPLCEGHGTAVAGPIAMIDNGPVLGITSVGVGPKLAILSARTRFTINFTTSGCDHQHVSSFGGTRTTESLKAITWLMNQGVRVLNESWAGTGAISQTLIQKYEDIRVSHRAIAFAAVGNGNTSIDRFWPSRYAPVNGVGAITYGGAKHPNSNFNGDVMMVAPGDIVTSTDWAGAPGENPGGSPPDTTGSFTVSSPPTYQGQTSLASSTMAGVAALMFA